MVRRRLFLALAPLALALGPVAVADGNTPAPPAGGGAIAAAPNAAKPVLQVDEPSLNLGTVKEGEDAVAVFKLKNTGSVELKILNARPG